jgi:HEAT repeat protein
MKELPGKGLSPSRLALAMRLNILTGCLATVWQIVCSPQPIYNVFIRNALGASASTLGLLVGLIQLSGVFQIVAIFAYGYAPRKKVLFVGAHLVHRILTISIAAAAFVAAAKGDRSWGIRAILITVPISWAFMNASSAGWWSWVADIFPENMRAGFFLKRSALLNVINIVWFFLAGMFLDLFEGPGTFWVYGVIFSVGAVTGIVDIVLNIFIPEPLPAERPPFRPADALEPLKNANFVYFSFAAGVVQFSINMATPFQSPFVVDPGRVAAPNTWLGIMYVISQLAWVLTAPFWGTVMDKWGRKPVVTLGCFFALSWIGYFFLTPKTYVYLLPLISIGVGLLSPAFYEGVNQMMLSLTPDKNRIAFVAWYLAIVGVVSAGGPIVGGLLFDALADFRLAAGPFVFVDFHAVQLLAIVLVTASAFLIARVKEGKERPISFVFGRIANPGIIRTYAYLEDLAAAVDPGRAESALRSFESGTGDLALDEILARLDDAYPEVREEAARALGRIASPLAVEPLCASLQDPSSSIRVAAARALGKIGDRRAVEALAATLREATSEELQDACVQALGDIGGDRSVEEVLALYRREISERVRASAGDAASRLGLFEAAWEIYPRLCGTTNATLRRQYAIALGNLIGVPGEFYRIVGGSESGKAARIAKLFERMRSNVSASAEKFGAGAETFRADAERIAELLGAEQEAEALGQAVAYAERVLQGIFGHSPAEDGFVELAFRVDQKLGAFAWILIETRRRIDLGLDSGESGREAARLVALLIVYFLAVY